MARCPLSVRAIPLATLLVGAVALRPTAAVAWDLSADSPFRVRAEIDGPVLASAGLVSLLGFEMDCDYN